jgi:hypothetical protein
MTQIYVKNHRLHKIGPSLSDFLASRETVLGHSGEFSNKMISAFLK